MTTGGADHWDAVFGGREEEALTWYEPRPALSLELIAAHAAPPDAVIDIGGGVSRLVDALLEEGYTDLTVLDLSRAAIEQCRARLGPAADRVRWLVEDITAWRPERTCRLWHDRAVFHFLTTAADRAAYVTALCAALEPGGHAIIQTFAEDGPERCSGLPVARYCPETLAAELERHAPGGFCLVDARRYLHRTPGGAEQRFQASVFRRLG